VIGLSSFSKYINVFDCVHIYAEASISDAKILHVAAITAELLDNNEDGVIDDDNIKNELLTKQTIMPIFSYEGSETEEVLFDNFELLEEVNNFCAGAVLYQDEISPQNPGFWSEDATVEEVLHTINNCGHIEVYPDIFGLAPNSSDLSNAMDIARGGQFLSIPSEYPETAWYHYDDWTCDYECMAMEYLYWCVVTNMGLLDNNMICSGIANEWELCTIEEFEIIDISMYNVITNLDYKLPQFAPDGNYCVENTTIQSQIIRKKTERTLDLFGRDNINGTFRIEIFEDGTLIKKMIVQ